MTLPLLFQFAKKNEKVMPPACIKFCTQPPLSLALLLSFPPMPPPPTFQVIIAQSLRTVQVYCYFWSLLCNKVFRVLLFS